MEHCKSCETGLRNGVEDEGGRDGTEKNEGNEEQQEREVDRRWRRKNAINWKVK